MLLCLFLLVINVPVFRSQSIDLPGYDLWNDPSSNRTDVYCPQTCLNRGTHDSLEYRDCCACHAQPCWEINATLCGVIVDYLKLEYYSVFGEAIIIANESVAADIHVLVHTNGRLSSLPDNLCDYRTTLQHLDLCYNYLTVVDDLNCLHELDTVRLDNNIIHTVSNSTFSYMTRLRVLSMRNNQIEVLEPNTITIASSNILYVDFSFNELRQTDITNILQAGTFCSRRFDGCDLGNITNLRGYEMGDPALHGPGDIYMNGTNIGQLIDFTTVGVTDYRELQKANIALHVDQSSIYCDCNVYQLLDGLGPSVYDFWPNLGDIIDQFICEKPEKMRNVNLRDYFQNGNYSDLTCGLVENCTDGCVCEDRSSEHRVVVDCRNRTLSSLPELVPRGKFGEKDVVLWVDGNSITSIGSRSYLSRIVELRLVNNVVTEISSDAILSLRNAEIDIRDQQIGRLDRRLQILNPNKITFGPNPVICDCENTWIGEWMRAWSINGRLQCDVNGRTIPAEQVTPESLDCSTESAQIFRNIAVGLAVFLTLCVIFGILHHFRLEFFLLKRRLFFVALDRNPVVFLSICETNDATCQYIQYYLRPCLYANKVESYFPLEDSRPGEFIDAFISKAIGDSDIYLVFLCEEYQDDEQSIREFDAIWKKFKSNTQKQIIVVIWAGYDIKDIRIGRLKAICKSGSCLDFGQTDSKLIDRVMRKLLPNKDYTIVENGMRPGFDIGAPDDQEMHQGPGNMRYRPSRYRALPSERWATGATGTNRPSDRWGIDF